MRRLALALLVAGLPSGGCLQTLLSADCEDECVEGERICRGDELFACQVDLWVSSCTAWALYQDCGSERAVCANGACACPVGLAYCGTCVDLATDPAHCGGCGIRCFSLPCLNGVCGP